MTLQRWLASQIATLIFLLRLDAPNEGHLATATTSASVADVATTSCDEIDVMVGIQRLKRR